MTTDVIGAKPRPARRLSAYDMLTAWHGLFAGAWAVAYLTGGGAMPLHRFAGYVLLGLLAVRLLVAVLARAPGMWALPWADAPLWRSFRRKLGQDAVAAFAGRTPLAPLSGLALLVAILLVTLSGLLADLRIAGDLHETMADASLMLVLGHLAVVASAALLRWLRAPAPRKVG
ncbi:MAG: cytochrome b/b6 domain-containing protein [Rhodospirillales bacterium]|nr:cytochrome b/b6 domain-containing protein [Rhodospirillales bacterium]